MKPLSKQIRAIFEYFRRPANLSQPRRSEHEELEQLRAIGQLREPAAIPELCSLLYSGNERTRDMAAATIQRIVETLDPLTLGQLDFAVRSFSQWRSPPIAGDEMIRLSRDLCGPLGMFSFHSNGHIRETAIRTLSTWHDGEELPFLLIRLNDWVRPVRDAAKQAVWTRIRPGYAAHFIRNVALIDRLRQQTRGDHRVLVGRIFELLCGEDARPLLRKAALESGQNTRRFAFRLLIAHPHDELLSSPF